MLRLFLIILFCCSFFDSAFAATSYRVNHGATVAINEFGTCKNVTNNHATKDKFISTNSSTAWSSFYNNLPADMSAVACGGGGEIRTGTLTMTYNGYTYTGTATAPTVSGGVGNNYFTFTIPSTATITGITIKGAGGGGGADSGDNASQGDGSSGSAITPASNLISPGTAYRAYCGRGGYGGYAFAEDEYATGGAGGWGRTSGLGGSDDYESTASWEYWAGGGGGGSSAIVNVANTTLSEAAGGNGAWHPIEGGAGGTGATGGIGGNGGIGDFDLNYGIAQGASGGHGSVVIAYTTVASVPNAPTAPSATTGSNQVTATWGAVTGATSYNLYWRTTSGVTIGNGTKITSVSRPYTHTGLTASTTYYYIVTAVNADGESSPSTEFSTTTLPAAPTSVSATEGVNQVSISWGAVSGATSYNIYWNTSAVYKWNGTKISSVTSPHVHSSLAPGETYYYIVTAVNAGGESAASSQVIATAQPAGNTRIFAGTGADQTFTVPAGITSLNVKMWGGGGGGGGWDDTSGGVGCSTGGGAGYATAAITVTAGQSLTVKVGLKGSAGGWPNGGSGANYTSQYGETWDSGTGGGSTSLLNGATVLIEAGGGGGGSSSADGLSGGGIRACAPSGVRPGANSASYQNGAGGGGYCGGATQAQGQGGSSYVPAGGSQVAGTGTVPGNSGDTDRSTAGNGSGCDVGGNGRVIIRW